MTRGESIMHVIWMCIGYGMATLVVVWFAFAALTLVLIVIKKCVGQRSIRAIRTVNWMRSSLSALQIVWVAAVAALFIAYLIVVLVRETILRVA